MVDAATKHEQRPIEEADGTWVRDAVNSVVGTLARRVVAALLIGLTTAGAFTPSNSLAKTRLFQGVQQATEKTYSFDFRGDPIRSALEQLVDSSGINLVYNNALLERKNTLCAIQDASREAVLHCILEDSGLVGERSTSGAFVIKRIVRPGPGGGGPALGSRNNASEDFTISGFISERNTGERLIGANVYILNQNVGAVTNTYGFYSITLPADSVYLRISYIGYQSQYFALDLRQNLKLDLELRAEVVGLETVEIVADRIEESLETTQMSVVALSIAQVKQIPAFLGESDVLKVLQLLPGVQSGGEGSSGLYVRGGGPDQNLILLDGAPVYNASHIFGFFSVFNPDALQHVQLTKGGFPARFGGRLSSVLEINMKEGNLKEFETDGAIGLIFSKLTFQGPIIKDKMSFLLSGRRTYIDTITKPFRKGGDSKEAVFFFGDLNAKLNYIASGRSRYYLSFYTGTDAFGNGYDGPIEGGTERFDGLLDWSNSTVTLRWNYLLSDKLFANTALTYSRYIFDIFMKVDEMFTAPPSMKSTAIRYYSGIEDLSAKVDFDYLPSPDHSVRFGGLLVRHIFKPGVGRFTEESAEENRDYKFTPDSTDFRGLEFSMYVEDDWRISPRLKANLGVHTSGMRVNDTFYGSLQPRISARYRIKDDWSAKASFGTMQQYLHLLTNSGVGLPTDLWVAATDRIPPQKAWQAAVGVTHIRGDGRWEISVEAYYKDMKNLIEYLPGATFINLGDDWQDKVAVGNGKAYGAELFVQKKLGRTTGWLGYTFSKTDRQFPDLNEGNTYPYRYDRRHDISLVMTHKLGKRWDLGATWVYGSGNAITLATARFHDLSNTGGFTYQPLQYYGERNSFRMRAYHRLDVSLQWHRPRQTWTLSVYNLYSRQTPFYYYGSQSDGHNVYKQVSLFPIIPSLTWSFNI